MNILFNIATLALGLTFSSNLPTVQVQNPIENKVILDSFEKLTVNHEDYTLNVSIENTNKQPVLVISMELKNEALFISPLEEKEFKGKFHFDFGSYKNLEFKGDVSENPISVVKILYPNYTSNKGNRWVTKNTTYKQALNLKTTKDFEVIGRIQFTIEPRCTFEVIPFKISYKNGKFSFEDAKC